MNAKYKHLPLKAYQIFFFGQFAAVYVGHTAGEAKAAFARSSWTEGHYAKDIWPNLGSKRLRDTEWELAAIEKYEDRGKYWRNTRAFARLQAVADAFNARYPVGAAVQVIDCCEAHQWPGGVTATRTPAWAVQGAVLVSVEGQAGGMYIKNIKPLPVGVEAHA